MGLFSQAAFYTTVNHIKDLPLHGGKEVAFVGRSNAGKSSAINTLANHVRLAYTSKTPGRTQHLNYFSLGNNNFLVDLPGYGYAKVPPESKRHWEGLLSEYLQTRDELCGLVVIMDSRHPLTELDESMLDWFAPTGKPLHILSHQVRQTEQAASHAYSESGKIPSRRAFSAMHCAIIFQFEKTGHGRGGRCDCGLAGDRTKKCPQPKGEAGGKVLTELRHTLREEKRGMIRIIHCIR